MTESTQNITPFNETYRFSMPLYVLPSPSDGRFGVLNIYTRRDIKATYIVRSVAADQISLEMMRNEVRVCLRLQHTNIMDLIGYYEEEECRVFHLVFEMCWGGELRTDIVANGGYSEVDASHCFQQVLQGVRFIHQNKIVHRYLKTQNIFLTGSVLQTVVKISDFTLACQLGNSTTFSSRVNIDSFRCFMAPEVGLQLSCTVAIDMWSCGVILYEMVHGKLPFDGEGEILLRRMLQRAYASCDMRGNECTSSECIRDLMRRLLHPGQLARPTAENALRHPFILKHQQAPSRFRLIHEANWREERMNRVDESPHPTDPQENKIDNEAETKLNVSNEIETGETRLSSESTPHDSESSDSEEYLSIVENVGHYFFNQWYESNTGAVVYPVYLSFVTASLILRVFKRKRQGHEFKNIM